MSLNSGDVCILKTDQISFSIFPNLIGSVYLQPEYEYLEYISKNLGKNWYSFFRFLGYSQGRIETYEIDEARNGGVSEVIFC